MSLPSMVCLDGRSRKGTVMVSVTKHKLDGTGRAWNATCTRADDGGYWLFCPAGEAGQDLQGTPMPPHTTDGIQLIAPGQWWTAWWWDSPRWIAIDIMEPIAIDPDGPFAYRDLELDLWWREGDCGIVDRDELQEAVERRLLAPDVAAHATRVAEGLLTRLQCGDPRLVETGFRHLDAAISPLTRTSRMDR